MAIALSLHFLPSPPPLLKLRPFRSLIYKPSFSVPLVTAHRRTPFFSPAAATFHDQSYSEIDVEKEKNKNGVQNKVAEQVWKESLEKFKEEALKVKAISEEAYEIYSKKAMEILMEMSENLKIQADKAKQDWSVIANDVAEVGKEYILVTAKDSPESVREVVEVYASIDKVKDISMVRDFYLGIPYGFFLSVGGFLTFMLTGSIAAIRFGVILGSVILALSVSSLRLWKTGKATPLLLKAQTTIATIIFLRQWLLWCKIGSFSHLFMLTVGFAMVAFYVYRIIVDGQSKIPIEETSDD